VGLGEKSRTGGRKQGGDRGPGGQGTGGQGTGGQQGQGTVNSRDRGQGTVNETDLARWTYKQWGPRPPTPLPPHEWLIARAIRFFHPQRPVPPACYPVP
jgi:hypothetical protein